MLELDKMDKIFNEIIMDIDRFVRSHTEHTFPSNGPGSYNAPGNVPAHVMPRLEALALSMGYEVRDADLREFDALGRTQTLMGDSLFQPVAIELDYRMNPASRARVFCHEIGHALLKEPGRHNVFTRYQVANIEEHHEEIVVELAAAMVGKALGFFSTFSCWFLVAQAVNGPEDIRAGYPKAKALAETILKVIG